MTTNSTGRKTIALLVIATAALSALLLWLGKCADRPRADSGWPITTSEIVDSRVVQDQLESVSGVTLIFSGEYKLRYSVAGRDYEIWHNAEISGDSREEVTLKLANRRPLAHYMILYNPEHPSQAHIDFTAKR